MRKHPNGVSTIIDSKRDDDPLQLTVWTAVVACFLFGSLVTMVFGAHIEWSHNVWVASFLGSLAGGAVIWNLASRVSPQTYTLLAAFNTHSVTNFIVWTMWLHLGALYEGTTRGWSRENHVTGWASWIIALAASVTGLALCLPEAHRVFAQRGFLTVVASVITVANYVLPLNNSTTNSPSELMWHFSWYEVIFFANVFRLNRQNVSIDVWYLVCSTSWAATTPGTLISMIIYLIATFEIVLNIPSAPGGRKVDDAVPAPESSAPAPAEAATTATTTAPLTAPAPRRVVPTTVFPTVGNGIHVPLPLPTPSAAKRPKTSASIIPLAGWSSASSVRVPLMDDDVPVQARRPVRNAAVLVPEV